MPVDIVKVESRAQLRSFILFPEKLYKGCDNWVPALLGDEFDTLDKTKNGAFEYCDADYFLAYKGKEIVGRVAAIINHRSNELWKSEAVRFGWLDFIEDEEVVSALINAVEQWGKERGCSQIKGPWGFTDMDKEGLLVDGYQYLSPFTCLYNYPYYDTLLQKIGLVKDVDWTQRVAYIEDDPVEYKFADKITERFGLHMAQVKSAREMADKYGMPLFHMYNTTFAPLFQFSPLTDKQIKRYIQTYQAIMIPDFIAVCLNEKDEPVGFGFCVPSLSKAVKKCGGRLFPFGFLEVLKALKKNDTLEALMIGVLPEYQAKGAALLIFKQLHENCKKFGITKLLMNPQLEENYKVQALFSNYRTETIMRRRAYYKFI